VSLNGLNSHKPIKLLFLKIDNLIGVDFFNTLRIFIHDISFLEIFFSKFGITILNESYKISIEIISFEEVLISLMEGFVSRN
jgi:hypothetical protein